MLLALVVWTGAVGLTVVLAGVLVVLTVVDLLVVCTGLVASFVVTVALAIGSLVGLVLVFWGRKQLPSISPSSRLKKMRVDLFIKTSCTS